MLSSAVLCVGTTRHAGKRGGQRLRSLPQWRGLKVEGGARAAHCCCRMAGAERGVRPAVARALRWVRNQGYTPQGPVWREALNLCLQPLPFDTPSRLTCKEAMFPGPSPRPFSLWRNEAYIGRYWKCPPSLIRTPLATLARFLGQALKPRCCPISAYAADVAQLSQLSRKANRHCSFSLSFYWL